MDTKKVWFVTGASKGLGLALVQKLLVRGYRVAATSRNVTELSNAVGSQSGAFLPLQMDLVDEKSVANAIRKTVETFGTVDAVVNNAGYGQLGTIEELTDCSIIASGFINGSSLPERKTTIRYWNGWKTFWTTILTAMI